MTGEELRSLEVGSLVREYQTGFYGPNDAEARFSKPKRVCEIYHRGVSRKGRAYVNLFLAFGDGLKLGATINEDDPTWQLEGHENPELAKDFTKRRNLADATGRKLLTPTSKSTGPLDE